MNLILFKLPRLEFYVAFALSMYNLHYIIFIVCGDWKNKLEQTRMYHVRMYQYLSSYIRPLTSDTGSDFKANSSKDLLSCYVRL